MTVNNFIGQTINEGDWVHYEDKGVPRISKVDSIKTDDSGRIRVFVRGRFRNTGIMVHKDSGRVLTMNEYNRLQGHTKYREYEYKSTPFYYDGTYVREIRWWNRLFVVAESQLPTEFLDSFQTNSLPKEIA